MVVHNVCLLSSQNRLAPRLDKMVGHSRARQIIRNGDIAGYANALQRRFPLKSQKCTDLGFDGLRRRRARPQSLSHKWKARINTASKSPQLKVLSKVLLEVS